MAELYRTFNPKMTSYSPDGWGRDSYILTDNGGIFKSGSRLSKYQAFKHSTSSCSQSPPIIARSTAYLSDGKGRDSYISTNYGGLVNLYGSQTVFEKTLRRRSIEMSDSPNQHWLPSKRRFMKQKLHKTQAAQARRLSSPKIITKRFSLPLL